MSDDSMKPPIPPKTYGENYPKLWPEEQEASVREFKKLHKHARPAESIDQVADRMVQKAVDGMNARAKTDPDFQVPY